MTVFTETFDDFENSRMKMSDFSKVTKIFPMLAQNFRKILLANPHNFSAKHVNLQLAPIPMFDELYY